MVRASQQVQALAFSGIHVISPRFLGHDDRRGRFLHHHFLSASRCRSGEKILAFRADEYYWRDLGRPENVLQAAEDLKQKVLLQ